MPVRRRKLLNGFDGGAEAGNGDRAVVRIVTVNQDVVVCLILAVNAEASAIAGRRSFCDGRETPGETRGSVKYER